MEGELDPDNVQARESLANFYFHAPGIAGGSSAKGHEQIDEIRKRDPKTAHLLLAGIYLDREETDKAKQEYRAVLAIDPQNAAVYYSLGLLYQNEKEWEEAIAAFGEPNVIIMTTIRERIPFDLRISRLPSWAEVSRAWPRVRKHRYSRRPRSHSPETAHLRTPHRY